MPVRFRCVYCNQLLGISRRKVGTIVRCTSCEGQLIVPDPNEGTSEPAGTQEHESKSELHPATDPMGGGLFERSDFDALLEPMNAANRPAVVVKPPADASPAAVMAPASQSSLVTLPDTGDVTPALVLTRGRLTLVCVLLVLGLGLSFAAGLTVGLWLR
jgi:hypothetical protein